MATGDTGVMGKAAEAQPTATGAKPPPKEATTASTKDTRDGGGGCDRLTTGLTRSSATNFCQIGSFSPSTVLPMMPDL